MVQGPLRPQWGAEAMPHWRVQGGKAPLPKTIFSIWHLAVQKALLVEFSLRMWLPIRWVDSPTFTWNSTHSHYQGFLHPLSSKVSVRSMILHSHAAIFPQTLVHAELPGGSQKLPNQTEWELHTVWECDPYTNFFFTDFFPPRKTVFFPRKSAKKTLGNSRKRGRILRSEAMVIQYSNFKHAWTDKRQLFPCGHPTSCSPTVAYRSHPSCHQVCHWTFAKITENLHVHVVSQKMNIKRDRKFRKREIK